MALRESFNQFAGKIVNIAEFETRVEALGISREERLEFHEKFESMYEAGQLAEISSLMKEVERSHYLTSKAVSDVEKAALQSENEVFAQIAMEDALSAHAADAYCKVLPMLKMMAFVATDNQKLLTAITKAAEECTDYRSKEAELQEQQSAIQGIVKKASAKFGL
jgi:transcriptional regulator with GAF, ATPase, and Fis domain